MKTRLTSGLLIRACGLIAGAPTFAHVTREGSRAELSEEVCAGDILADGEKSLKLNGLFPSR